MQQYLVLKLDGVMQSWGGHTYEDFRHTEMIPTRSGLLGLLAACLGIDRKDAEGQETLASSLQIAVRVEKPLQRIKDFHTVSDARKVDGKVNKFPVVSQREYIVSGDTRTGPAFAVLLHAVPDAHYSLDDIESGLKKPVYTPFLGRRSCPITRPLFDGRIEAIDVESAFALVEPVGGTIYSETAPENRAVTAMHMRDQPLYGRKRQFANRQVFVFNPEVEERADVPQ